MKRLLILLGLCLALSFASTACRKDSHPSPTGTTTPPGNANVVHAKNPMCADMGGGIYYCWGAVTNVGTVTAANVAIDIYFRYGGSGMLVATARVGNVMPGQVVDFETWTQAAHPDGWRCEISWN